MLVGASSVPVQDSSVRQVVGGVLQDVAVHVRECESSVGDDPGQQVGVQHLEDQLPLEGVVQEAHALDVELHLDVLHQKNTVPSAPAVLHVQSELGQSSPSLAVLPDVACDHVLSLASAVGHHALDLAATEPWALSFVVLDERFLEVIGLLHRTPALRPDVVLAGIKIGVELVNLLLHGRQSFSKDGLQKSFELLLCDGPT